MEVKENALILSAGKSEETAERSYLHRGIATRSFERRFQLADHVHVVDASHVDGMLHVDLKREVPEALNRDGLKLVLEIKTLSQAARTKLRS